MDVVPPADNADLKHTRRVDKSGPEVTPLLSPVVYHRQADRKRGPWEKGER